MIILASKSPRRQELMQLIGLEFQVMTEDVDETMDPSLPLKEEIKRVSGLKAAAVRGACSQEDIIIAADTMVAIDNQRLGKPKTEEDAVRMLQMLSGNSHDVITGLTVMQGDHIETASVVTQVAFRTLTEEEIRAYVATGEPMDKAGAYAIQGKGSIFVSGLIGDYFNVMGLPLCTLSGLLRKFGIEILK